MLRLGRVVFTARTRRDCGRCGGALRLGRVVFTARTPAGTGAGLDGCGWAASFSLLEPVSIWPAGRGRCGWAASFSLLELALRFLKGRKAFSCVCAGENGAVWPRKATIGPVFRACPCGPYLEN
jgi:hypothetical protein